MYENLFLLAALPVVVLSFQNCLNTNENVITGTLTLEKSSFNYDEVIIGTISVDNFNIADVSIKWRIQI